MATSGHSSGTFINKMDVESEELAQSMVDKHIDQLNEEIDMHTRCLVECNELKSKYSKVKSGLSKNKA